MFKTLIVIRIPLCHKKLIKKKEKMEEKGPKLGF